MLFVAMQYGLSDLRRPVYLSPKLTVIVKLSTVDKLIPPTPFMYTPLHGTGGIPLPYIMHQIGIGTWMLNVDAQFDPDPTFRTVRYPNPEEDGTLDIAMSCAENNDRPLLIANDPDADRLAVAQKMR